MTTIDATTVTHDGVTYTIVGEGSDALTAEHEALATFFLTRKKGTKLFLGIAKADRMVVRPL